MPRVPIQDGSRRWRGCHGRLVSGPIGLYTWLLQPDRGLTYCWDGGDGGVCSVLQPEINPCIPIVVDIISMDLLKGEHDKSRACSCHVGGHDANVPFTLCVSSLGSTLHFATELIGSTFRLENNPQAKEGGNCGCGVSWEPK